MIIFLVLSYWGKIDGSAWQAIVLGAGWELLFRSGIYTGSGKRKSFRGPYDLMLRLQVFLLSRNDGPMAQLRWQYVDKYLPSGVDCLGLCDRILLNVGAWPIEQTRKSLVQKLEKLRKNATKVKACRHRVAYLVLDEVGRHGFQTLLSESLPNSTGLSSGKR
jgi:hypothetical protein